MEALKAEKKGEITPPKRTLKMLTTEQDNKIKMRNSSSCSWNNWHYEICGKTSWLSVKEMGDPTFVMKSWLFIAKKKKEISFHQYPSINLPSKNIWINIKIHKCRYTCKCWHMPESTKNYFHSIEKRLIAFNSVYVCPNFLLIYGQLT